MSLAAFIGLVSLEDCVAGGDCFFCLCAHRLAPRLLLRAFDSVLEARGLRCGARAAFRDAASRNLRSEWTENLQRESKGRLEVPYEL